MWILVNIGCIECGVSSEIVGVFTDKERAEAIAREFDETYGWREGGQNSFQVFPMPETNRIHPDYQLTIDSSAVAPVLQIEG